MVNSLAIEQRVGDAAQRGPAEPVLAAQGLRKTYGRETNALLSVTLTIEAGERVALIGPNGSGKSTLLKCLVGVEEVTGGEIAVLGERFERLPTPAQRMRIRTKTGFVFQQHGLVKRLSVLSNVVHGRLDAVGPWRGTSHITAPPEVRAAAMAALHAVGLADKALARADALSGGQQQRVAIARALVRSPRLMIADEPAASLDPNAGREVMALFADLARKQGATLLFTTHDLEHALSFADRIVALRAGEIVFDRASDETDVAALEELFLG